MEFEWWEIWKFLSLTTREKMLIFHKGHQKREQETLCKSLVWSTHLQSWLKTLLQALDKTPMWCVLLILWLNLFCTTLFLGFFEATCWNLILVCELPCWVQIILLVFSLHHLNQPIWNEVISKQTLTFGIHFAITNKIGERKICQFALAMFIYRMCKDCNFQCRLWVTPKWFRSNNIIVKEFSWTLFLWLCPNPLGIATLGGQNLWKK